MSIPVNHHHVSRCQSDRFLNKAEGKIYTLSRETLEISWKPSTRKLFSEDDGNTKARLDDLSPDRSSLEDDLRKNFEDHYDKHVRAIEELVRNPLNAPANVRDSIIALTKFGLIGEIRHPVHKKGMDDMISQALFGQIMPIAAPELKAELEAAQEWLSRTKYSNTITYSEHADRLFALMGDINYKIFSIESDKCFVLPDTTAARSRAKINQYFNPDIVEVAIIGIPLNSKLLLHSQSVKLAPLKNEVMTEYEEPFPGEIEEINYSLLYHSHRHVACESRQYLEKFRQFVIDKIGGLP